MKKQMRLVLVAVLVAVLAITVLSFTVFGETAEETVTPVNGVYTVENAEQLVWVFQKLGNGTIPATATIKLANDIDVGGKLTASSKIFTGIFDGNGKTISGLTAPLFKQFNGTAKNLTLRGKITDEVGATASFALNTSDAKLTNIVSYVDLSIKGGAFYVGGLVGTARNQNTFADCEYRGELTVEWNESACVAGGILGYGVPDGKKIMFDGCLFGGKLTVSGGVAGKLLPIGGIFGQAAPNGAVLLTDCTGVGTITSAITAGTDYVGGIFGLCESAQNSIEYCANKSKITAVSNAGGILGGIAVASKLMNCTNFGEVVAATKGELCGSGKGVNLSCFSCYGFSDVAMKLCGTDYTSNNSQTADALSLEKTFTLGDKEYEQYNRCTVDKETGLLIRTLNTLKKFEAYISTREEINTQAIRFVIVTNCDFPSDSMTVSIQFKDLGGKVIKTHTGKLGGNDSDFSLYGAVAASGENYFAANGCAIFGCVITNVPIGGWDMAELTVTDTKTGEVYLEPVKVDGYTEYMTVASLPDLAGLGTVSDVYNCGPGLASDQGGYTAEDSYMVVVSDTSKEKFEAYVNGLENEGFSFVSKTTSDGDDYYTYSRYGKLLYLYYSQRVNEIRIIADNSSDPLNKISYEYEAKEGEYAAFYQYSINYTLNDQKGFDPVEYTEEGGMNCGMLYVLKTADNKVIIIDGGYSSQLSATAKKAFVDFLYEITGTPAKEKVKVAMWFFTHAHGDHVAAARDIMNSYNRQLDLESVMFNFPSYQVINDEYDGNTFTLKETIGRYYPDVLYHKLHTGEEFSLGGIDIEVLYTHEDAVAPSGATEIVYDFNSTSTLLRFTIEGKTFTILGDLNTSGQEAIINFHSAEYMKSDLMQAAHHGYNHIGKVYDMISAQIVVFPQSMRIAKGDCVHQYKAATGDHAEETYFAHKWTYKFTVEDGVIKSEKIPRYDQK